MLTTEGFIDTNALTSAISETELWKIRLVSTETI